MVRERVLLSEGSSLTARETMTILGSRGIGVDVASASHWPLASFSTWCRGVRRVPSAGRDPVGYLRAIDALLASGRYRALLATHEQAWLLAAGREHLPHVSGRLAVAEVSAFEQVQSKIAFAGLWGPTAQRSWCRPQPGAPTGRWPHCSTAVGSLRLRAVSASGLVWADPRRRACR